MWNQFCCNFCFVSKQLVLKTQYLDFGPINKIINIIFIYWFDLNKLLSRVLSMISLLSFIDIPRKFIAVIMSLLFFSTLIIDSMKEFSNFVTFVIIIFFFLQNFSVMVLAAFLYSQFFAKHLIRWWISLNFRNEKSNLDANFSYKKKF